VQLQRQSPLHPLKRHNSAEAVASAEQSAALSGYSRATCLHNLQFQRFLGCFPPVISAEVLRIMRKLQHLSTTDISMILSNNY